MDMSDRKNTIINILCERGFTREQAAGFVDALEDSELSRQVNELTGVMLGIIAVDTVDDFLL